MNRSDWMQTLSRLIMRCRKQATVLASIAIGSLLINAVSAQTVAAPDAIRIGMSAPFTGPSRNLGSELYLGATAYFESVNNAGGVNGRRIELIAYDDQYQPDRASQNTLRLLHQDHVFALFSYVGTPTTSRVLPLLEKFKNEHVYLFFPFTGAEPLRNPPYDRVTVNLRASYREETAGLVNHLLDTGHRRIAVFFQADAYGRDGWAGIRDALENKNYKMVGEATYKRNSHFTDSFDTQVAILERSAPDAIICIASYAAAAGFIRDARRAKFTGPIANVSFAGLSSVIELLQQAGKEDGRDYTAGLITSTVVPPFDDDRIPAVHEYRELMQRRSHATLDAPLEADYKRLALGSVNLEGFLNAKLLVAILKQLGKDPKRADIPTALSGLSGLDLGIDVPLSFHDSNQGQHAVYYDTYQNGVTPITDWTRWRQ